MKNLIAAQRKFNNMYERVSTTHVNTQEVEAVRNYGQNMINLYGKDNSLLEETKCRVNSCGMLINQRNNEVL